MSDDPVDRAKWKRTTKSREKSGKVPADPPPPEGRIGVCLCEEAANANTRACAAPLRDLVFMRGTQPMALVQAAEAGGTAAAADDELEAGIIIRGVRHGKSSRVLTELSPGRVQYLVDEAVLCSRFDVRANAWRPKACPLWIAQRIIAAATEMGFRPIAGIVAAPLFIRGSIVTAPGYHDLTGLYLTYRGRLGTIPRRPSKAQALVALEVMIRWCRGYLADLAGDELLLLRVALLSAVLTAVLRPSLATAPAILIDGTAPGLGKGKLARGLASIASGEVPALLQQGHSSEEFEKRIDAVLLSGAPVVLCDNLKRQLASSALESSITEAMATIRTFGTLASVTVPVSALVILTANNLSVDSDMLRRMLSVRLVAKTERPESRVFDFDPAHEARADRDEILTAAHVVLRAWWQARNTPEGREVRKRTLGSFEQWADLVAAPIAWLTGMSPIELIEQRKNDDPRRGDDRQVAVQLVEEQNKMQQDPIRPRSYWQAKEMATLVPAETWARVLRLKGEAPTPRECAEWLRRHRERVYSWRDEISGEQSWQLTSRMDRKGIMEWTMEKLPGLPGGAGVVSPQRGKLADRNENGIDGGVPKHRGGVELPRHHPATPAEETII